MPSASFSVTTTRAPDEVLPYLADLRNATDWQSSIVDAVELVAGEPGDVGARFLVTDERAIFDDVVVDYRTTEAEPGVLLVFATKHPKFEGRDTYRLAPVADGGTAIEYTCEFTFSGLNKIATPFGGPIVQSALNDMADELVRRLEG